MPVVVVVAADFASLAQRFVADVVVAVVQLANAAVFAAVVVGNVAAPRWCWP